MFFACCLNICAHFDILRESFKGDNKKFVQQHEEILELAENLIDLYKPVVLVQYCVTSMILCVLGVQLVMLESYVKRLIALTFGISMILQLFIYSYGGQLFTDKSSSIADHLYDSDKDLILIIARAKKATTVKVGLFYANLPNFRAILSSAASLITLMKSFID